MQRQTIQRQVQVLREKAESRAAGEIAGHLNWARLRRDSRNLTLFLSFLAAATLGRIALQGIPSVEPIIPFAVLAGLVFGMKEGFVLGGSAYLISNFFVWGLQGPWTVFQALGAALPGLCAGLWGKLKRPNAKDLVLLTLAGTLFFEVLMNLSGVLMGIGLFPGILSLPLYFALSIPFSAAHIATNLGFAFLMRPLLKLRREENGFSAVSISRTLPGSTTSVRMYRSD